MSKDPHARKRKKLLEEKKQKARQAESLVIHGDKYRKDKLTPTWMYTEIGISQTYAMTDRQISDETVESAIKSLVKQMRAGALPPLPATGNIQWEIGLEQDFLIENVRRSWAGHFATHWEPSKEDLIGVLRTLLGSIQTHKSPGAVSHGYLRYLNGFLTKLGVTVNVLPVKPTPRSLPLEGSLLLEPPLEVGENPGSADANTQ